MPSDPVQVLKARLGKAALELVTLALEQRLIPFVMRDAALADATRDPVAFAQQLRRASRAPSFTEQLVAMASQRAASSTPAIGYRQALEQITREQPELVHLYRLEISPKSESTHIDRASAAQRTAALATRTK